jgi:hypothetical protein
MKTEELQKKIEKKEKEIQELKRKLDEKIKNIEWIKVPELGIEVQSLIHHEGKSYNDLVKEFGRDYIEENLLTYAQLQFMRNSEKYRELFGLLNTNEFVKQEDDISKKNGYVARFYVDSDFAYLDCNGNSDYSYSALGVRFAKKILDS